MDSDSPEDQNPQASRLRQRMALLLATGLGVGKLPRAPGTWGSALAILPGYGLIVLGGWSALVTGIIMVTITGIWASNLHYRVSGIHDQGEVVIDEIAGQWLAMLPLVFFSPTGALWGDLLLTFAAFRFFDIVKPWPVDILDSQLKGGLGVMMDDLAAGLYAALVLGVVELLA